MNRMTLEQADHFLRHMYQHAKELRDGSFSKDPSYMSHLRDAQYVALEISHDMIHVMRTKKFEGYEDADFDFDVKLPTDWKNHEFKKFDYSSFTIGIKLKKTLDLGLIDESNMILSSEEAVEQLKVLGNAIQDAEVFLKMLQKHFH